MNLVIDVGNSYVKLAVFEGDSFVEKEIFEVKYFLKKIQDFQKKYLFLSRAILSSVSNLEETDLKYLKNHFDVLILNSDTKLPFTNLYSTPKTLGIDRLALVSAAVKQFPETHVLVIDAGTCITFDFITQENKYLGGAISPGIRMRYKALNNLTANLPLLETEIPKSIIGDSTAASIHSGVVYGVLMEIDGVISDYKQKYSDLTIILTGGDTKILSKELKSSIFANSNFLLEGLNQILQYNSNE